MKDWRRLTGDGAIDPDFYLEDGEDAVYESLAIAERVFGEDGAPWPRLLVAVYERDEGVILSCSRKSAQGQWWEECTLPFVLVADAVELLQSVANRPNSDPTLDPRVEKL